MASQRIRNDLGRQLANTLHLFRLQQRREPESGVLAPDDITIEATETGYTITVFEPTKQTQPRHLKRSDKQ